MTVQTTNIIAGPYNGNDVTEDFPFEFLLTDQTYITVFETDDEGTTTELTLTDDYTVDGVGDPEGGTVTRVAGALPTGYVWYLRANYPYDQLTAFASQGGFFPQVHEYAFDKLTMLVLQLFDRINRAPSLPDYYPLSEGQSIDLPSPDEGTVIGWGEGGELVNIVIDPLSFLPAPETDKVLGWDADGNLVNLVNESTPDPDFDTVTTVELTTEQIESIVINVTENVTARQYGSEHLTVVPSAGNATFPVDEAGTFDITLAANCTVTLTATDVTKSYTFTIFATTSGAFNFTGLTMAGVTIYKREGTTINLKASGSTVVACTYIPAIGKLVVMEADLEAI